MAQKGNVLYTLFILGILSPYLNLTIIMKQESQISLLNSKRPPPKQTQNRYTIRDLHRLIYVCLMLDSTALLSYN